MHVSGIPLLIVLVLSCQFNIFDTSEWVETSSSDDLSRLMFLVWEDKAAKLVSVRISLSFLAELLHDKIHLSLKTGLLLRGSGAYLRKSW